MANALFSKVFPFLLQLSHELEVHQIWNKERQVRDVSSAKKCAKKPPWQMKQQESTRKDALKKEARDEKNQELQAKISSKSKWWSFKRKRESFHFSFRGCSATSVAQRATSVCESILGSSGREPAPFSSQLKSRLARLWTSILLHKATPEKTADVKTWSSWGFGFLYSAVSWKVLKKLKKVLKSAKKCEVFFC